MSLVTTGWRSLLVSRRAALKSARTSSGIGNNGLHRPSFIKLDTPRYHDWTHRSCTTSVLRTASWESLKLNSRVLARLRESYPRIDSPTPAQEALLLALDGEKDLFLRDAMGRGKTFILALACLRLIEKGEKVMVLVPTPQLVELVQKHLDSLSPDPLVIYPRDTQASIWISTPKQTVASYRSDRSPSFTPTVVMIDEPETLLSPLPPRHLQPAAAKSHPFHKHPPPLASLLDSLFESREGLRTFWFGAELNGLLKRIVRQRVWAARDALELDFCSIASRRSMEDVENLIGAQPETSSRGQVSHVSLLVGQSGEVITPELESTNQTDLPPYRTGRPVIDQAMIDAIVQYHHQHPTMSGTTTLVLPPEGYPLDLLSARLDEASTATGHDLKIQDLTSAIPTEPEASMTVAARSSVPGLDIPNLARVVLINGLDLSGLSLAQRTRGGVKRRLQFYDVVCGRMGRLGSVTHETGGQVVMCVSEGTGEELSFGLLRQEGRNYSPSVP